MNSVNLVGNLTRDPELRTTQSGLATCSFTIAINRPKSKDGVQQADYIPIVTWRTVAENCARYLAKGRKVAIVGEIRTRSYDAKDGTKRYVTEVLASSVEFLTPRNQQNDGGYMPSDDDAPPTDSNGFVQVDDEELPF